MGKAFGSVRVRTTLAAMAVVAVALVADLDLVPRGRAAPATRVVRQLYRSRAGASAEDLTAAATATFAEVGAVELPLGLGAGWAPLVGFVATA